MAHVFLSHSSADAALADALHAALAGEGHDVFLDHHRSDGIAAGAEWERVLYEELERADALVCVVTPAYVESRWCFAEVALAKARGRLIVPVTAAAGVRHPLLHPGQAVAYAANPADATARLLDTLAALDAAGGAAWDPARPVYPGLRAFDVQDRATFFGRDREAGALAADVRSRVVQRRPRALLVVGASGSGKSSLVRAGLVPRLLDDAAWWRVPPFAPGDAPLDALADALARARKEVGLPTEYARVRAALPAGVGAEARAIVREAPGDRRQLLVVVDQIEEAFTRAADAEAGAFLSALGDAAAEPGGPVAVVATLRSEFVGDLLRLPGAARLGERPYLLAPLGREHLEDVVTRPARLAGIAFEPTVVRRLVDDAGSGEALPLLAFTLARLTDGLTRGGRVDDARYWAVGGVRDAVAAEAERALGGLVAAGRAESDVMDALLSFVTLDDHERPTRRRRRRAELPPVAAAVVDAFVDARLLTVDSADGDAVVGVTHETLFTAWDRMRTAIARTAESLRLRRDLEREASRWALHGRAPELHWRGERLRLAERLVAHEPDVGEAERAFVQASAAEALEHARREAVILVDRVVQSRVAERDSELALLYLLASVDEYAPTPDAIAAMRMVLAEHRLVGRVGPTERPILAAAIDPDRARVVTVDEGTNEPIVPSTRRRPLPPVGELRVTVWRVGDAAPAAVGAIPGRTATSVRWAADGARFVVAVDDGHVVLDADTLAVVAREGMERAPRDPSLRVERFTVDVLGEPADAPVRDTAPAAAAHAAGWIPNVGETFEAEAISPDGRLRCVGRTPRLVDTATGEETPLPWGFALAAAFSGDGRRLALATRIELGVIDVASRAVIATLGRHSDEEGDTYASVALNGDGSLLVSGSLGGGRSHAWDVATGARLWSPRGRHVAVTRDGALVAAALHGRIAIRAAGSRPTDEPLAILDAAATRMTFDPEGRALLAAHGDAIVELSIPDGGVAARYPAAIRMIGFSPDGRHVLGRAHDDHLRWPDRTPDAVVARARRAVFRALTQPERDQFELHARTA